MPRHFVANLSGAHGIALGRRGHMPPVPAPGVLLDVPSLAVVIVSAASEPAGLRRDPEGRSGLSRALPAGQRSGRGQHHPGEGGARPQPGFQPG
ncbi:conserved protein of unknown function [Ectopseudomonas oleovorans]|uniref:Uncharacterized protein n=1 Tax=Ectopseudomonas oleovorans TaxID=301 RepID=A0A653BBA1_ECTOL|nr:conserved protein of unknown function [Pseudomonas oleovorans]